MKRAGVPAAIAGVALGAFAVDALAVDEVIVTTRKREENLQSVPIAVDAITAEDIEQKGISSLEDVIAQSPSVILDQGFAPQDQRIVIRGLSPTRGRQNVAVLQDGVDVSSEAGAATAGGSLLINPRLFDLERVEIVKGPQIALYGRSAFAGAINYVTRKPGDEFRARAGTDIGSDGQLELSGSVDGPLGSSVSAGIAGMVWSHDGFYDNTLTGQTTGDSEGVSVAGTLVWKITDGLKATARLENLNDEFGVTPYAVMPFNTDFIVPNTAQQPFDPDGAGPLPAFAPLVSPSIGSVRGVAGDTPDGDDLVLAMSEDPRTCDQSVPNTGNNGCRNYEGSTRDVTRGTLDLEWDLGAVTFTSLTHYADAYTTQAEGSEDVSTSTSSTPGEFFLDQDTNLFSQELRVASNGDGAVSWLVGGLFWQEKVDVLDGSLTCLNYSFQPCGPTLAQIRKNAPLDVPGDGLTPLNADQWHRDTDHYSVFGLVEWEFIDSWKVTLEGRQTWEEVTVLGPDVDNGLFDPSGIFCTFFFAPACPQTGPGTDATTGLTTVAQAKGGDEDDSFFAPKVTLTWTPASDMLYYASFAESFKPKGISALLGGTGAFYDSTCGTIAKPGCTDPIASFRFDQEKLDNYELGAKTAWFDRALRLNGAVFFQDFKNKQVSTQIADPVTGVLTPRIINAGKAEVWGVELDATWYATENLTFNIGYTWLDTEYTDFKAVTTGVGTIAYVGNCTMVPLETDLNGDGDFLDTGETRRACETDYSGNELEGAPEHAAAGGVRWQDGLVGNTDYFLAGDFQYQADRFASDKNLLVFPSYWLFNFRAGITNDSWDILAYVDNAFDDDTVKSGFEDGDIPTFFATNRFLNHGTLILPDPRTYGLRVNYRFGAK
ncbi:MAG: TonB-dependent receptor [Gammaproteobacteria bacterium]|nr:TonB-dependent receptor [Gammaproteobacteria bacterium]